MSEAVAGSIIGYLRLDADQFMRAIGEAQAASDHLDGKDVKIQVKADTAGAETKLAAVAASEDRVSRSSGGAAGGLDSVVGAARRLADASGQANVAQLRLGELQGSGTAKASQIAKAENDVERAQRTLADATWGTYASNIKLDESNHKVDDSNKKVTKSSKNAGRGMGALAAAIITLGPALVPLVAGTAGLAVGFGAMGAAGILAVVGIVQEMKAGTPLGLAYTGMLKTLKGDLTTLSHTAASGVLAPFQVSVVDLQKKMPALNSIIGEFSVITGKTAGVLTTGLVAAFIALAPLARDAGVYVLSLSTKFAAMMSGPGVVSFGDYVRSVFPQVMQAVESIVGAAVHLVAALAPLGLGTLGILRTFTDLINALPINVLAVLAQGASSVYIGFTAFKMLSGPLESVGGALRNVGVSAETAAAGVRTLTIAAGVIGAIITVATLLYSAHAESVRKDQQAVNDLSDALRQSNGVLDENVRKVAFKSLTESGAIATAKQYGISLSDVTSAALGYTYAQDRVTTAIDKAKAASFGATTTNTQYGASLLGTTKNLDGSTSAFGANTKAQGGATNASIAVGQKLDGLQGSIAGVTGNLKTAEQEWKDQAAAVAVSAAAGDANARAQQNLAAKLGITVPVLLAVEDGQKKTADAAAVAAAKMSLENDAAGILKMGLDLLNGKAISAAQAQNAFDSSLVNMGDHVNATGKKITFTTTSIKDMSSASVALRGQLNSQVTNLQTVIEANGGLANSTGKARAQMKTMRQQIIDNAVAHGVDKAAVTAYIDKLLKIPKSVPPTKLDVDKAAAEAKVAALQAQINALGQHAAKPKLGVDTWTAAAQIEALQRQIDKLHGKTVYTDVINRSVAAGNAPHTTARAGANGYIASAFASGGFENHVAQIAPAGAMRLWAEPETGGEAYIPLAASKRARSTAIWEETGKRLGVGGSNGGPVELGPNTIRALGREIAARPMMLDGAQVSRNVDSRLVPR